MFLDVILPLLFLVALVAYFYVFYVEERKRVVSYTRMLDEFYMYAKNKNKVFSDHPTDKGGDF